jgi:hypothetical protein
MSRLPWKVKSERKNGRSCSFFYLLKDIPATGPGPWKVFMLINVHANEATKKQVEIRLHTYPHLVANVKNRMDQGAWVIVAMLGDFYLFDGSFILSFSVVFLLISLFFLADALQIFSEWSEGTRGPIPRLAKGFVIWEKYRDKGVKLSTTAHTREEVRAIIAERQLENTLHGAITVKEALTGPVQTASQTRKGKQGGGGSGTGKRKRK